jgi:iron complex outermembrane receptor protein
MRQTLLVTLLAGIMVTASARQPADTTRVFSLGEVTKFGNRYNFTADEVHAGFIRSADLHRASDALAWVPGLIVQESSARAESNFVLRGIAGNAIPVYIDGVPLTAAYDGIVDLYRLPLGFLSKVDVSRSASSLLLGGNTLGPSVNFVSRRPVKPYEVHFDLNTLWHSNLNLGGRWGKWYAQADVSWAHEANFHLPDGYHGRSQYLDGGRRLHSSSADFSLSVKGGYVPHSTDEYVVGYNMIRASKEVPPYLGKVGRARFWKYTDWDKDQLFFHSRTMLTSTLMLTGKVWYDRFYNVLASYDDETYSTQTGKQGFNSTYDDYTLGAGIGLKWATSAANDLTFGLNYKNDVHRQHDDDDPTARMSEGMASVVVEDTWRLSQRLALSGSLGWSAHKGYTIEEYSVKTGLTGLPKSSDNDLNALLSIDYRPGRMNHLCFTASRESHFATLKDRYSYKKGKALPNPDLKTENAWTLSADYEGRWRGFSWSASAYYFFINDMIQEITGVDPSDPKIWQLQNRGKAQYRGFDLGAGYECRWLTVNATYSFIDQQNSDDHSLKFLYSPASKGTLLLELRPVWDIRLQGRVNSQSRAYSLTDGTAYTAGFATVDACIARRFSLVDVKIGAKNVMDKCYEYAEGYPMRGRQFYIAASVDL